MIIIINITAIVLYLLAASYQAHYLFAKEPTSPKRSLVIGFGMAAAICQAAGVYHAIDTPSGIDLGFFRVSSLFFCFITALGISSTLRRPTDNLLIALYPLAALSIVAATISSPSKNINSAITAGMLGHIVSSILAYSILTIAAIQAAALGLQERQLKHHHLKGMLRTLPPLQTMEAMLFELIWIGVVLLGLSIISGLLYVDNIFAQHLIHKSVLTIAAWFIFSIFVWGRHQLGWRSAPACAGH